MCEEDVVDCWGRVGDREGGCTHARVSGSGGDALGSGDHRGCAAAGDGESARAVPQRQRACEAARASRPSGSSAPARMSRSGGDFARESARASVSERVRVEC
jgi:hypothetical protein